MQNFVIELSSDDLIKSGRTGLVQKPVEVHTKDGRSYTRMTWCRSSEDEPKSDKSSKSRDNDTDKTKQAKEEETESTYDSATDTEPLTRKQKVALIVQHFKTGDMVETINAGKVKLDHVRKTGVGFWYYTPEGKVQYQAVKSGAFYDMLKNAPKPDKNQSEVNDKSKPKVEDEPISKPEIQPEKTNDKVEPKEEPKVEKERTKPKKPRKSTIKTLFNKLGQSVSKQIQKEEPNFYTPDESGWMASDFSTPEEYLTDKQQEYLKEITNHMTMSRKQLLQYHDENSISGKPFSSEVDDEEEYENEAKYRLAADYLGECVRHIMGDSDDAEFKAEQKKFKQYFDETSIDMKPWSDKTAKPKKSKGKSSKPSDESSKPNEVEPKAKTEEPKTEPKPKESALESEFKAHDGDLQSFVSKLRDKHGKEAVTTMAKESGVNWKEHDNPNINWMRCAMALKSKFDTNPKPKAQSQRVMSNPSLKSVNPNLDLAKFNSLMSSSKSEALNYLKSTGVTWKEHDNKGINWMRAMMAMNKHVTDTSKPETEQSNPNIKYTAMSGEKAVNYVYKLGKEQAKTISDVEYEGLSDYMGSYHHQINSYLRTGKLPKSIRSEEDKSDFMDVVNTVDKITQNNVIPDNLVAYRGTSPEEFGLDKNASLEDYQKLVGSVIQDNGLKSVTLDKNIATQFKKGVVVHLQVPEGTPGVAASGVYKTKTNFFNKEAELLLGKGCRMKITSATKDGDNIVVSAQILSDKQSKKSPKSTGDKTKDYISELKTKHSKDYVMSMAKNSDVHWKEHDNPNINWMRCAMALKQHLDKGGTLSHKDSTTPLNKGMRLIIKL